MAINAMCVMCVCVLLFCVTANILFNDKYTVLLLCNNIIIICGNNNINIMSVEIQYYYSYYYWLCVCVSMTINIMQYSNAVLMSMIYYSMCILILIQYNINNTIIQ